MTNKTKLQELIEQSHCLSAMSTCDLDSLKIFIDDLKNQEHAKNRTSTLWHELWHCGDRVATEQFNRAKDCMDDTFLTLLEEFRKRVPSSINEL